MMQAGAAVVRAGGKPVGDGDVLADLNGPRFQAFFAQDRSEKLAGSPMHNPFGRLKLVSMRDIAENNYKWLPQTAFEEFPGPVD